MDVICTNTCTDGLGRYVQIHVLGLGTLRERILCISAMYDECVVIKLHSSIK